jgi:23S rRNA (adenine2503-C2)-methyltransferase
MKISNIFLIIGLILFIRFMKKGSLCGLSADEISKLAGTDNSVTLRITNAIYKKGKEDISLLQGVSRKVRDELISTFRSGLYPPSASVSSTDGTVKYLFRNDKSQEFETVFLSDEKRKTVCISSQSGCRMGCPFCATGRYGFRGDLEAGDIVNQVISIPERATVTHVVFMGMGEPLDNIDNVLKACSILTAEWGLALSPRNITVSTVGITAGISRFLSESECNLALSLYSPFPDERIAVVPAEKHNPVIDIIEMLKVFPLKKKRRISLAYVMMKGINDTDDHLTELKNLLHGSRIRVNLLPYHKVPGDPNISSSTETMMKFKHELVISGISSSIRKSRGVDVYAACGLLAAGMK